MADIRRTIEFRAPIELVWTYLTDSDKIAQWMMPNTFLPVDGRAFTMDCPPGIGSGAPVKCVVTALEAPAGKRAHLAYSWEIDKPPLTTQLTMALREQDGVTTLDLVHSGWQALGPDDGYVRDRHEQGWDQLLEHRLRPLLEGTA